MKVTFVFLLGVLTWPGEARERGLLRIPLRLISRLNIENVIEKVNSLRSTWKADRKSLLQLPMRSLERLLGEVDLDLPILPFKHKITGTLHKVPREFDARRHWTDCPTIAEVRDQGVCGSCWAVATSSAFSDRACIAGLGPARLAESEVLACCEDCGRGCVGGNSQLAWNYFISVGAVSGGPFNSSKGCQPYELEGCEHDPRREGGLASCADLTIPDTPLCQRNCTNPHYPLSYHEDLRKVSVAYILRKNVTEIQHEILTHGPVAAAMAVYTDFYTYQSGIYQQVAGEREGSHAVRLLGWGSEGGEDYWLAANSWNSHWGEDGFFRIRRGVNECGIESKVTAGLPAR